MYNKNMLNKKSIKKSKTRRKYRSKHSIRNRKKVNYVKNHVINVQLEILNADLNLLENMIMDY